MRAANRQAVLIYAYWSKSWAIVPRGMRHWELLLSG